jgi:signal transduction histidine kinase
LFGSGLALLIAVAADNAIEYVERQIIQLSLADELRYYAELHEADPNAPLPHGASLRGYRVSANSPVELPALLKGLAAGIYELQDNGRKYHVIVGRIGDDTVYLMREATLFEKHEAMVGEALVAVVAVAALLAFLIGYLLSHRVMAPVANLASRVALLRVDTKDRALAHHYARDEVGELAAAFDRYHLRLTQFVEREKEFAAEASHELRTPLTVIKSAAELLVAQPELPPRSLAVVRRIERAATEMSDVVETLLLLARELADPLRRETTLCRVAETATRVVEMHRSACDKKGLQVSVDLREDFALPVPPAVLQIVLGNLLRNAIAHSSSGHITVTVDKPRLTVADEGIGIAPDELPRVFERHFRGHRSTAAGSGLGLTIVKRLCERYGWQITLDRNTPSGTAATIHCGSNEPKNP